MARRIKSFYRRYKGKARPDIRLHRDHRSNRANRTKQDREVKIALEKKIEKEMVESMDKQIKEILYVQDTRNHNSNNVGRWRNNRTK